MVTGTPRGQRRARRPATVIVGRRAAVSSSTPSDTIRPACGVAGCAPMSASRFTVACCIRRSASRRRRGRESRRGPSSTAPCRRRRRARRSRVAIQRQAVRRHPAAVGRAVVEQLRTGRCAWCATSVTRPRAGGVVQRLVPLVAQACRRAASRSGRPAGSATDVLRQNRSRPNSAGTSMAAWRAGVDREDRPGQCVLGTSAVGGRTEPRIAPGAGPDVRLRDRSSAFACVSL